MKNKPVREGISNDKKPRIGHRYEVIVAVVVGTLLVVMSYHQNTLQRQAIEAQTKSLNTQNVALEAQVWLTLNQHQLEITKLLIENHKLVPYFDDGEEITNDDENYNKVMAIADAHLDFFEMFEDKYIRMLDGMGPGGKYWKSWEKYFIDSFSSSPALCLRYFNNKEYYSEGVANYAKTGCKEFILNKSGTKSK